MITERGLPDGTREKREKVACRDFRAVSYVPKDTRTAVAYDRQPVSASASNSDDISNGQRHISYRTLAPCDNGAAGAEAEVVAGSGGDRDQVCGGGWDGGLIRGISPSKCSTARFDAQIVGRPGRDGHYVRYNRRRRIRGIIGWSCAAATPDDHRRIASQGHAMLGPSADGHNVAE